MSFKTTGVLAVILIALGAFWYVYDYKGEEVREEKAKLAKRMFQFETGKVRRVFVATGDTTVVCERQPDSTWVITSPVRTEADRWTVDLIVSNVGELDRQETIAENATPETLADYGLRRPSFRVYLEGAGIDTILAGDDSPTGGFTYVKLAGRPEVLAVGAWQVNRMRKTLYDLRDKTALPFEREQVGRVEISAPNGQVVLTRNGQVWQMERPVVDRADEDAVSRLLTNLSGSKVRAFKDEAPTDLGRYGLRPPQVSVTLFEGGAMTRKTLDVGDTTGGWRYAKYSGKPPVFAVDTSFVNIIAAGMPHYRHKAFAEFERERVTKVEVVRPDSTLVCERDTSGAWNVVRPFGKALDREKGDALLTNLNALKARAFVAERVDNPAAYGFDRPALVARLWGKGGPVLALTLGKKAGEYLYARVDRKETVYQVDERTLQDLWPALKERFPEATARPDSAKKG